MRRQTRFTGISPAVWKECYDRDGGICRHCGKGGVLQAAHYVCQATRRRLILHVAQWER